MLAARADSFRPRHARCEGRTARDGPAWFRGVRRARSRKRRVRPGRQRTAAAAGPGRHRPDDGRGDGPPAARTRPAPRHS